MPLINQNIKVLRKRLGLTQERFAEEIGIKRSLIGAYEESRAIPPAENLSKMANYFQVSLDQLLNHSFEKQFFGAITKSNEVADDYYSTRAPKNEPKITYQPDLFSDIPSTKALINSENNKIRYISNTIVDRYITESHQQGFFEDLPCFSLPFLPKGYLRAFDAPEDFLIADCVLVAERVDNFDLIKDGENHLIIKRNGLIYRRIYNQIKIKNTLLLSSDKDGIPSDEVFLSDIFEIWLVKSYISKSMPLPTPSFRGIKSKVDLLKSEIDEIILRQSKP